MAMPNSLQSFRRLSWRQGFYYFAVSKASRTLRSAGLTRATAEAARNLIAMMKVLDDEDKAATTPNNEIELLPIPASRTLASRRLLHCWKRRALNIRIAAARR
jgi:hypothetical protein